MWMSLFIVPNGRIDVIELDHRNPSKQRKAQRIAALFATLLNRRKN
jgi:hypothetical protein